MIGSTFNHCRGICLIAENANEVELHNNVFFNGQRYMMRTEFIKNWNVTNNVMLNVYSRVVAGDLEATTLFMYFRQFTRQEHMIKNVGNIGQGS